jgi:hypothetical protein
MTKALLTGYTCPVCRSTKNKLLTIMEPLDYADVEVTMKSVEGPEKKIKFVFDIREGNFFYCKNCRMRFNRIDPSELIKYKEKRIPGVFTDCILKECRDEQGGRIGTYKDVAIGSIYMKGEGPGRTKRREMVKELLQKADLEEIPDPIDNFLKEFSGEFTLDQAGICNECGIVVTREVDLK